MRKFSLFLLLIVCSVYSKAQSTNKSSVSGWVVLNSGDTLHGSMENRDWNENPSEIKFQRAGSSTTYKVNDLRAFGVEGNPYYNRFTIQYHLVPMDESVEYPLSEDSTATSEVWLKILVNASISLGEYTNHARVYFYSIKNNIPTELIYSKGIKNFTGQKYSGDSRYGKTLVIENTAFKQQLFKLNLDNAAKGDISGDINPADYDAYSLTALFYKLNDVTSKVQKSSANVLFAGVGAAMYSQSVSASSGTLLQGVSFGSSVSPYITVGYQLKSARKSSHFTFYGQLAVSTMNTTGTQENLISNTHNSFSIKNTFLEVQLLPTYVFNPFDDIRVSAGAGLDLMFKAGGQNVESVYSTPTTYENISGIPAQRSFTGSPLVSVNVQVKKLLIFANYQVSLGNITNYLSTSWTFSRATIGIAFAIHQ